MHELRADRDTDGHDFSDTGLTASTSYSYRVRATDAASNLGAFSNTAARRPAAAEDTTPPRAPSSVDGERGVRQADQPELGAATDNVGVTGYRVERCQARGARTSPRSRPGGTAFSERGSRPRRLQLPSARVDAANNLGPYSNTSSATTQAAADTTPPRAPGTLTATRSPDADQLELGSGDGQRRRDRLSGRALPGRGLHQLRADRDADRHHLRQHRADAPRRRTATGCARRRGGQSRRLLEHEQRRPRRRRRHDAAERAGER